MTAPPHKITITMWATEYAYMEGRGLTAVHGDLVVSIPPGMLTNITIEGNAT